MYWLAGKVGRGVGKRQPGKAARRLEGGSCPARLLPRACPTLQLLDCPVDRPLLFTLTWDLFLLLLLRVPTQTCDGFEFMVSYTTPSNPNVPQWTANDLPTWPSSPTPTPSASRERAAITSTCTPSPRAPLRLLRRPPRSFPRLSTEVMVTIASLSVRYAVTHPSVSPLISRPLG